MTEISTVRVYVNSRGVDVAAGATALDAVRLADHDAGAAVAAGQRRIADSRGLPIPADAPVYGGAIYRLVSARAAAADSDDAA